MSRTNKLYAPNEEMAKQLRELYPGFDVEISEYLPIDCEESK